LVGWVGRSQIFDFGTRKANIFFDGTLFIGRRRKRRRRRRRRRRRGTKIAWAKIVIIIIVMVR
jgi:hypothetical protein